MKTYKPRFMLPSLNLDVGGRPRWSSNAKKKSIRESQISHVKSQNIGYKTSWELSIRWVWASSNSIKTNESP